MTIEPHEFLDFLRGRLASRFVDGQASLERRLAQMELAPDTDGRYRVNEFFCYDDMWRAVLTHLVASSSVVLMDLRGFSEQHAGLAFELRELMRTVPATRIVILIDEATQLDYLKDIVTRAWHRRELSAEGSGTLRLLRLTGAQAFRHLDTIRTVCASVPTSR